MECIRFIRDNMLKNVLLIDGAVRSTVDSDYDAYTVIWDELEEMGSDEIDIERSSTFDSLYYRIFFNKESDLNLFKLLTKSKPITYRIPSSDGNYLDEIVYQYRLDY